jgi:hypothetical protein
MEYYWIPFAISSIKHSLSNPMSINLGTTNLDHHYQI